MNSSQQTRAMLTQCCFNAEPAPQTTVEHYKDIGAMSRACFLTHGQYISEYPLEIPFYASCWSPPSSMRIRILCWRKYHLFFPRHIATSLLLSDHHTAGLVSETLGGSSYRAHILVQVTIYCMHRSRWPSRQTHMIYRNLYRNLYQKTGPGVAYC